jgi:hypothetical protein
MAVIFRLSARGERGHRTCCFCGRDVESDPVEFFVFWPGDEDPTPWFGHAACVARQTSIRKPGARPEPGFETGS